MASKDAVTEVAWNDEACTLADFVFISCDINLVKKYLQMFVNK